MTPEELLLENELLKEVPRKSETNYVGMKGHIPDDNLKVSVFSDQIPQQEPAKEFETGALREESKQEYLDGPLWALKRIGTITYEGMNRYGKRNWRKGMPINETFNHVMNHLLKWSEGDRTEDHLAKICWGIMVLMIEEDIKAGIIERDPFKPE